MAAAPQSPLPLALPFTGRWLALNSPASRVPSHGTDQFGSSYAIDFVAVDDRDRSAPLSWRTLLATEPADAFLGFGMPILAPLRGSVVAVHDGEPDHAARRSIVAGVPYLLSQGSRAAQGAAGVAGNHVIIAAAESGPFVLLAHLQRGSVAVRVGDAVAVGDRVGACGNSGNSTQPHVHVQATDSMDWTSARGIPITFSRRDAPPWVPRNREAFFIPS
jgi:hypothetical protein